MEIQDILGILRGTLSKDRRDALLDSIKINKLKVYDYIISEENGELIRDNIYELYDNPKITPNDVEMQYMRYAHLGLKINLEKEEITSGFQNALIEGDMKKFNNSLGKILLYYRRGGVIIIESYYDNKNSNDKPIDLKPKRLNT